MKCITLGITVLVVALSTVQAQVASTEARSLSEGARILGRSEADLRDVEMSVREFVDVGLRVTSVKAVDRVTGEVIGRSVDQFGRVVSLGDVRKAAIEARSANPLRKIDPALVKAIEWTPAATLPVIAWLKFDGAALDRFRDSLRESVNLETASDEVVRELEANLADFVASSNAATVDPFVRLMRSEGFVIRYVSTTAPVVFIDSPASAVASLAGLPDVDTLYLETNDSKDGNADANATHRTDRVHQYGVRGRGVRVALLEDNGIDPACPHLNVTAWFNPGTPDPDNHIHGTAGCVASQLASRLGSAPDVDLYSANATTYSDSDVTAAGDWIAGQSLDATNLSFGPNAPTGNLRYIDRYFDYQARFTADSYVASAGNSNIGSFVGNVGWNVIAVGSHTDNDDGNWTGDVMSTFSSTGNPSTGCEKPNLCANGQDVDTLGEGPGWLTNDYNGTSFSAPHCTGNLANAMNVSPVAKLYPEACIALLMATAWHNIEGATRLSDQDGAGGLHGLAAYRVATSGRLLGTNVSAASFSNNGFYTRDIFLQGGDRTRVAIGWFSQANSGYTTDVLDADLDLTILAGQGATSGISFGGSLSFNNNFEIVEFTPPTTGWYTVRVNDFRFDGTSEGLGIAWSQKYADTSSARLRPWSPELSPVTGPTIGNPSYYMDFRCPNSPNASYVCFPSGTKVNGFGFSPQTWSPLDIDVWTNVFFEHVFTNPVYWWFGYAGTLSGSGTTLNNLFTIPDAPFLVGYTLYHVGITQEAGLPDGVKEITETDNLRFWPAGTTFTMGDDTTTVRNLPFTFKFFGVDYTSININSNGSITFGGGDVDFTETSAELLSGLPRVAFAWDDLNPSAATSPILRVREIAQGEQAYVVEFINVAEYATTNNNTVRVTLNADNSILIEYLDCALADCIVGVSPGAGLSGAAEVDLSKNGDRSFGTNVAIYEVFSGGADSLDLDSNSIYWNKVGFVPTTTNATIYRLKLDL